MILLEKEFDFFIQNQEKLFKKYPGKYIVIKNNKILGSYPSISEAISETSKVEKLGTFLVQKCASGKKVFTQVFHSRVRIV
jgi:hypothetical protein